jgi:hypothetical protein
VTSVDANTHVLHGCQGKLADFDQPVLLQTLNVARVRSLLNVCIGVHQNATPVQYHCRRYLSRFLYNKKKMLKANRH